MGSRPYEGTGSVGAGVRLAEEHGLQGIHARGLLNLGVIALERQPRLSLERSRAALTLAAALLIWRTGVRRYTSTGS